MIRVMLKESGGGALRLLGTVPSIDTAHTVVDDLDQLYGDWEAEGFPDLRDPEDIRYSYEGCDIYAHDDNGRAWMYIEDDCWEEIPPLQEDEK